MKKSPRSILRISAGVAIGFGLLVAAVWILSLTLGNSQEETYHGQTLNYWIQQSRAQDPVSSNAAFMVIDTEILPSLEYRMFNDTNDSNIRTNIIALLNALPGVIIYYTPASGRRSWAASLIGEVGPAAKGAVPQLIRALQSDDADIHEPAIQALGEIHAEPGTVIPLLMRYLDDYSLNDEAATALGKFGPLARPAVPKIIPLLQAADDDAQVAAKEALRKIDPAALTNALSTIPNK